MKKYQKAIDLINKEIESLDSATNYLSKELERLPNSHMAAGQRATIEKNSLKAKELQEAVNILECYPSL